MSVNLANLRRVALASAAITTALQSVTAVAAIRKTRRDYVDSVWGPGLGAIALASAALGSGDPRRRWALAAVTTGWATRLATLMSKRVAGRDTEDPRYTEFLGEDPSTLDVITKVFVTQGLAQLIVSAPIQLAAASSLPRSARRHLLPLGVAVMVTGAVIEALADRQKSAFQERSREERPPVLDTGLWGWSRHPNYFGDSLVWDGAWLAAAASAPGGWTLPAPIAMSYFLIVATGARRTERIMQNRPSYSDYKQRVAFFFPRPPKHA